MAPSPKGAGDRLYGDLPGVLCRVRSGPCSCNGDAAGAKRSDLKNIDSFRQGKAAQGKWNAQAEPEGKGGRSPCPVGIDAKAARLAAPGFCLQKFPRLLRFLILLLLLLLQKDVDLIHTSLIYASRLLLLRVGLARLRRPRGNAAKRGPSGGASRR